MVSGAELGLNAYAMLVLSIAVGFGILYALLGYLGATPYEILLCALAIIIFEWYASPKVIEAYSKLRYISDDEYPQIHDAVSKICSEEKVRPPRIAICPAKEPNAFVFGRSAGSATLAIHEGLMLALDKDELEAVLAQEIAHLKHSDTGVITFMSFIPLLAYIASQGMLWYTISEDGSPKSVYYSIFGMLAFIIFFLSELFVLPISRAMESFADEYSVRTCKEPKYLSRALYKITMENYLVQNAQKSSTVARAFYIIDFFNVDSDVKEIKLHIEEIKGIMPKISPDSLPKHPPAGRNGLLGMLNSLFLTHVPTYKRILDMESYGSDKSTGAE